MTVSGNSGKDAGSRNRAIRNRRRVLAAGLGGGLGGGLGVSTLGCKPASEGASLVERLVARKPAEIIGGFVGADLDRGHLLRSDAAPASSTLRRTRVAIIGSGIAGLAAARALRLAGIDDFQIFELDSKAGGNSRHGEVAGHLCPWGAHYLPTPDLNSVTPSDLELISMLREFGLIKRTGSGEQFAEEALCHAPQERVLVDGQWQTGLLPIEGVAAATIGQYQRFAEQIRSLQLGKRFSIPAELPALEKPGQAADQSIALDKINFAQWLNANELNDPSLRWYLDYCCRDDYGADCREVSAWAGLHYFASRHGFAVPVGSPVAEIPTEVLTWPQGNSWLVQKLAATLGDRLRLNALVRSVHYESRQHDPMTSAQFRMANGDRPKGAVKLEVWMPLEKRAEQWLADFVVMAIPLNVAARIMQPIPAALAELLPNLQYSAWQVANLHLRELPPELPGAPLSWDNVIHGRDWLGFVDASHQILQSHRRETVWTSYRALGSSIAARRSLMTQSWREQTQQVLADLRVAYPAIDRYVNAIDVVRWGHAMIVPTPGLRSSPAFQAIRNFDTRVYLAHSDLAGYSIFEEAFAAGFGVGKNIAKQLRG